jgi:arginase family enzyme
MATDISIFFQPVNFAQDTFDKSPQLNKLLADKVDIHNKSGFPELNKTNLAIIGVNEDRRAVDNKGCAKAPDAVRQYLYKLTALPYDIKITDLGNIKAGADINDTYFALSSALYELHKKKIVPIVIGGGHDLTFACYQAYAKAEQTVNIATVDAKIDLGEPEEDFTSQSFVGKIIIQQPNYLFNYCNLAQQNHFVGEKTFELLEKLHFETFRLGDLRADINDAEAYIRNADIFSFDMGSIRCSDSPGNKNALPNGLFGEEACRLARYAGMSDKLTTAGFFELNPKEDTRGQSAHLLAQMIWYFIEGYANRKNDFPLTDKKSFIKYRVTTEKIDNEIIFYKSKRSGRWWMEVPYPVDKRLKFERHHLVPCTQKDYELALSGELPDLWWKTFHKLS